MAKDEAKTDAEVVSDAKLHDDETPNVSTSFNTTPMLRESDKDVSAVREGVAEKGEYVVLDLVLYMQEFNEAGDKVVRVRKYNTGQTVQLTPAQAYTLTLEPRPSVRKKEAGE